MSASPSSFRAWSESGPKRRSLSGVIWSIPVSGKGPAPENGAAAKDEARSDRDYTGDPGRNAKQIQAHKEAGGESGRSDVKFFPHKNCGLASEHVADDAPEAGGQHAHRKGGYWRDAE